MILSHALRGHRYPLWFRLLFDHGNLGVRIFFVISGYLITGLLVRERDTTGSISVSRFYARRALRLLPAFCAFIATVAILDHFQFISLPSGNLLYAITYTMNFAPNGSWWTGHLWSLSVEEQFYIVWPLAMTFLPIRSCAALAVAAIWAGVATREAYQIFGFRLIDPVAMRYAFPYVCGAIATGCLLAIYEPQIRRWSNRWAPGVSIFALIPVVLLMDAIVLPLNRLGLIVSDCMLALLVGRAVLIRGGFLNSSPMLVVGVLSYSLYLWQQLFFHSSSSWLAARFPFNALCVAVIACASYRLIERPFLDLRRRLR